MKHKIPPRNADKEAGMATGRQKGFVVFLLDPNPSGGLYAPYPVGGWRRDVDSQRSPELLHLHSEEQRRVRHFLHLLLDELRFCGFLKVFGFGDLVHKAHDLAGLVTSSPT